MPKSPEALIIVDMLHDFVRPDGNLSVPEAENCIGPIVRLRKRFHEQGKWVVFLCDAHEPEDPEFTDWPAHSVRGTPGAQVVEELAPEPGDIVVPKAAIDVFTEPTFPAVLDALGIGKAIVSGVATEYCVHDTTMGILKSGRDATVVHDGIKGVEQEGGDIARAIDHMAEKGARFVESDTLLQG
jgi:nicotinamidase-related amidase